MAWIGGFVPEVQANLSVAVAAIFLYLPAFLLNRRGEHSADHGLTTRPLWRNVQTCLLVSLIVFPPYAVGFHYWQLHVFERTLEPSADHYLRLDPSWEGRPASADAPAGGARLWVDHDRLVLQWGPAIAAPGAPAPFGATVKTDGAISVRTGRRHVAGQPSPGELRIAARSGESGGSVTFRLLGGSYLKVHATRGTEPLGPDQVLLGPTEEPAGALPVRSGRSLGWLLWLVAIQMLLVALPEEFFYRGYLQGTLDRVWPRRIRILGVECGLSIVVVSAMFALGHFVVGFDPQRLAVFFPSLLFGWMRARTGSIAAATAFHGLCNIVVDVLGKSYI